MTMVSSYLNTFYGANTVQQEKWIKFFLVHQRQNKWFSIYSWIISILLDIFYSIDKNNKVPQSLGRIGFLLLHDKLQFQSKPDQHSNQKDQIREICDKFIFFFLGLCLCISCLNVLCILSSVNDKHFFY